MPGSMDPRSANMSYVLVSSGVAILKCSGAALMSVPPWLSQATTGVCPSPFSTAITSAGPLYPRSSFFSHVGSSTPTDQHELQAVLERVLAQPS